MRLPGLDASLVFNGEIYNFRELRAALTKRGHHFKTSVDTEVILHLYEDHGVQLVQHLQGMFAFALWDGRERRLLLARDRLGVKPLYYRLTTGGITFGSEARVVVTPRTAIRTDAVWQYLRLGWVPGPGTIYDDVYELPPACCLLWQEPHSVIKRYWTGDEASGVQDASPEALSDALHGAVERQLVADVPLGVFLSAGVDSVALARLASEHDPDVYSLTVGFDHGVDESTEASALARRLGLSHEVIRLTGSDVLGSLPQIVASMDQPTVDGCNTWLIARAAHDAGLVVALSGLGGDELFGGYSTFHYSPQIAGAGRLLRRVPRSLLSSGVGLLARARPLTHSRFLRAAEAVGTGGESAAYAAVRGLFSVEELRKLWPRMVAFGAPDSGITDGCLPTSVRPVTRLELSNYLPFQLLRDTDVMSMAHSLEVRVPLLDDALVNITLARQLQGRAPFDKSDLLQATDPRLLPLASRPKNTFTLPFSTWMHGPLRQHVAATLEAVRDSGLGLHPDAVSSLQGSFYSGRLGWRPLWAVSVLGAWLSGRNEAGEMAA